MIDSQLGASPSLAIYHLISNTRTWNNRPFSSCFEPHYESEAKCKDFVMKISFHSYANKLVFI